MPVPPHRVPHASRQHAYAKNGKLLWKQIEADKSGNSHSLRSAAWNNAQFAKPFKTHGVDVCPRKNGQEWQLAWGLLSVIPDIGYSPNRGEPLIVSLPGGLSNRENNSGGAPRAKQTWDSDTFTPSCQNADCV